MTVVEWTLWNTVRYYVVSNCGISTIVQPIVHGGCPSELAIKRWGGTNIIVNICQARNQLSPKADSFFHQQSMNENTKRSQNVTKMHNNSVNRYMKQPVWQNDNNIENMLINRSCLGSNIAIVITFTIRGITCFLNINLRGNRSVKLGIIVDRRSYSPPVYVMKWNVVIFFAMNLQNVFKIS